MLSSLTKLSEWFYRQSKGFVVLIFLALEILFAGLILPFMQLKMGGGQSSPKPLDLYFGFTPEEAYSFLASLSAEGRSAYLQVEAFVDIVYPLIYTTLFILAISYFFKRAFSTDSSFRIFNLFPLLTLLADLTENTGIITLLLSYPAANDFAVQLANCGNYTKWATSGITVLLLLIGIGTWVTKLLSKKRNPSES